MGFTSAEPRSRLSAMQRILRFVAGLLDRVPSAWGIPLLVLVAVLIWLGLFAVPKLFGL